MIPDRSNVGVTPQRQTEILAVDKKGSANTERSSEHVR
jgi:hypothetical protein